MGLDLEVESRIDDGYSIARVITKMDWYSSSVRWSRGGASGSSGDGCKVRVVSWVCGRGFCGYNFVKGVTLGYLDGIFLGQLNGCELGASDGVFLRKFEWTPAG